MDKACLNKGEDTILREQGMLQYRLSWKLGHLFLTNRRLFFLHATKKIFEISLDRIIEINIAKRTWILGTKVKQICIDFKYGSGHDRVYIALVKPEKWNHVIKESMILMLAERWGCNGANSESPSNT